MQRPHKLLALVVIATTAGAAPALAAGIPTRAADGGSVTTSTTSTTAAPTASQIKAALKRAESSDQLWATINQCDAENDVVGIRGEMPSLSFDSKLVMIVSLDQWSSTQYRYVPVKGTYRLGGKTFGPSASVQEGVTLHFSGSVTVIGRITFEWYLDNKLLGSTSRTTTGTHNDDAGTPRGYSVGTCSTT